eukprot:3757969-Ditylum_brightwellii.AAC.1
MQEAIAAVDAVAMAAATHKATEMNAITYAVNEEIERNTQEAIEAASAVANAANMIRLEELAAKEDEIKHYEKTLAK